MNLQALPEEALKEILALTEAKKKLDIREEAVEKFMPFAHHVYENFIEGRHHRIIAEKLESVAQGKLKRLIINMPPRHSKSEFASFLDACVVFGPKSEVKDHSGYAQHGVGGTIWSEGRDLIDDPQYKDIFPDTNLEGRQQGRG